LSHNRLKHHHRVAWRACTTTTIDVFFSSCIFIYLFIYFLFVLPRMCARKLHTSNTVSSWARGAIFRRMDHRRGWACCRFRSQCELRARTGRTKSFSICLFEDPRDTASLVAVVRGVSFTVVTK
jgi:hypothetical protein